MDMLSSCLTRVKLNSAPPAQNRPAKDKTLRIKNDHVEYVGHDTHLKVINDRIERVGNDQHLYVVHDHNVKIGDSHSLQVQQDWHAKVGNLFALKSGMEIHLKAGMKAVIEAGTQLSLKVGGSFITIDPSGVSISGPLVRINSGGSAASGSGASPDGTKEAKEAPDSEGDTIQVPAGLRRLGGRHRRTGRTTPGQAQSLCRRLVQAHEADLLVRQPQGRRGRLFRLLVLRGGADCHAL
jgi:hypothetical protein